jgi:hypothetical protein
MWWLVIWWWAGGLPDCSKLTSDFMSSSLGVMRPFADVAVGEDPAELDEDIPSIDGECLEPVFPPVTMSLLWVMSPIMEGEDDVITIGWMVTAPVGEIE